MAGTTTHGKKTRLYIETTPGASGNTTPAVTPANYTLLTGANQASLQLSKDMADASVFNDENHSSEAGLKGGTIPFSARFKRAEAALLIAAWNTDATSKVLYRPEGDGAGKFQSFADYHIGQLEIGSSLSDTVSLTGTFTRDGAVATGVQA